MIPKFSIIAAVAENGAIGLNNQLLVHVSSDLKRFKQLTTGHTIIMGRKTFESLPSGPLPNRRHIILTHDKNFLADNCIVVHSVEEVISTSDPLLENFVIGGAQVYKLLLSYSSRLYLTRIYADFKADSFFPTLLDKEWQIIPDGEIKLDEKSGVKYQYINYSRIE